MSQITFTLNKPNDNQSTAIICNLRYGNRRARIRTKQSIHPKNWNVKTNRSRSSLGPSLSMELNSYLDNIEATAKSEFLDFIKTNNREPEPTEIKKIVEVKLFGLKDKQSIPKDFYSYWDYFVKNQSKSINSKTKRQISDCTIKAYRNTLRKIKEFEKSYSIEVSFENIDLDFYYSFKEYLENENYSFNTIGKHIKILKTVLNDATSSGVNKNLKFRSNKFVILKKESDAIYLNEFELAEIEKLDLKANKRLEKARDQFLLLCYTGQRYQSLKDIVNAKNREGEYIKLKQDKSEQRVLIPILPQVKRIFDKYEKIEILSNVKLNEYIKEVCKLVPNLRKKTSITYKKGGKERTVNKPIYTLVSTHTGRRSFATNFYNRKDFPISLIMAITGHKKESTFFSYIRTTPEEHAQRFMKIYNDDSKNILKVV